MAVRCIPLLLFSLRLLGCICICIERRPSLQQFQNSHSEEKHSPQPYKTTTLIPATKSTRARAHGSHMGATKRIQPYNLNPHLKTTIPSDPSDIKYPKLRNLSAPITCSGKSTRPLHKSARSNKQAAGDDCAVATHSLV